MDPAKLAEKAKEDQRGPSDEQVAELRTLLREARDKEAEKADLEERLKTVNIRLNDLYYKVLPEAFVERGTTGFKLAPEGNHGEVEYEMSPYYKAVISSEWEPERQQAAFSYLEAEGHEDLIKTNVVLSFPREARGDAVKLATNLRKKGYAVDVLSSVHWSTLTSWLREQVEKHQRIPDLEKIGGTVGRIVKAKKPKNKG